MGSLAGTTETQSAPAGMVLPYPYLLFLGDADPSFAKTAYGLRDWARDKCVGEYRLPGGHATTGLTQMTPVEAQKAGARSMVVGIANPGGIIPEEWTAALAEALEAGLDLISGMHSRLSDLGNLGEVAQRTGRRLIDVRIPPAGLPVGTGRPRSGKRLLTVGTDCALGKKYTALAITEAFQARGVDCDFRATGQTGIMIAGGGIPMDSVISDFLAGAAETLSPDADPDHWDIVEGQGSLFHPSYAGVSLGLLHGSQPDVLVLCHEAQRTRVIRYPDFALPSLQEAMDLNLTLARRTNPAVRMGGISVNTADMSPDAAEQWMADTSARLAMPVADPVRGGPRFQALVDNCLSG